MPGEVVTQAYSNILHLKPNVTTFHATLYWLQAFLSLVEWQEQNPTYLQGPVRTWRNWDPSSPFPAHSAEAKCESNLLHSLCPGQYGMLLLPSDAVKDGQTDCVRGAGGAYQIEHGFGDGPHPKYFHCSFLRFLVKRCGGSGQHRDSH